MSTSNAKKKVLLIGWDAADWKVIDPLIQQGKMPALKSLIERGVFGKIQTLDPPLSPMLWTSIATGYRADKHGIGGFVEPNPDGTGLRPVTSTSRKVRAIWNILHNQGYRSNVVAWWPSNPAEPINGVMVSNHFQVASKPRNEEWVMPKGTIHPESMSEELKEWRVHPSEITLAMAVPFVPNLAADQELRKTKRTSSVLKVIANASSVHAVSTYLQRNTEWDFMAVYHDAIDHFSHLAMRFHPPRRPEIDEKDFENYQHVVESGYRFHDMMLERTLQLIDDKTTVILVSDHGFHCDHQRPKYIPKEPSGPAVEHSPYGIFVMAGPGVRSGGQRVSGASVLDISPTILAHLDLPVGEDMEGKVLHAVFDKPKQVETIPSWEDVPGDFGTHDPDATEDPWQAMEALQQLVELGYIEEIGDDKLLAVEKAQRENQYYVARNLLNGKKWQPAIEILEKIYDESKINRYGQRLAFAYLSTNRLLKCKELIAELRELERKSARAKKREALKKDPKDPFGNAEYEEPMYLEFVEGLLNLKINKPRLALPILERVQKKNPANLQVALNIGRIHNQRKNYTAAEKQFIRALAVDERNAYAHHGLGLTYLRRNHLKEAVDEFFAAIDENFYMPNVHYHLGEAFYRAGYFDEAAKAFEVAVRLSPGMAKAHKWLVDLYTDKLSEPKLADEHQRFLEKNIYGELWILTGLSGSNYQELLLNLEKESLSIFQNKNAVDEQKRFLSPRLKSIHKEEAWLQTQVGNILYVPPQYLNQLPTKFNYKVVYLKRDAADCVMHLLKAQNKMHVASTGLPMRQVNLALRNQHKIESWLESQPGIEYLFLEYDEFTGQSKESINQIKNFFV